MKIEVHFDNGAKWTLDISNKMTVSNLKEHIFDIMRRKGKIFLFFDDKELNNGDLTLEECGVKENSVINILNNIEKNVLNVINKDSKEEIQKDPPNFDSQVEYITNMGFQREQVKNALRNNSYDSRKAISVLFVNPKDPKIPHRNHDPPEEPEKKKKDQKIDEDDLVWTQEDDDLLFWRFLKYGNNWNKIYKSFYGRTAESCRLRWMNFIRPAVLFGESREKRDLSNVVSARLKWTSMDDEALFALWQVFGDNWNVLNKHFVGKTPETIRQHWEEELKPQLIKEKRLSGDIVSEVVTNVPKEIPRPNFEGIVEGEDWTEREEEKMAKFIENNERIEKIIKKFSHKHKKKEIKLKYEEIKNSMKQGSYEADYFSYESKSSISTPITTRVHKPRRSESPPIIEKRKYHRKTKEEKEEEKRIEKEKKRIQKELKEKEIKIKEEEEAQQTINENETKEEIQQTINENEVKEDLKIVTQPKIKKETKKRKKQREKMFRMTRSFSPKKTKAHRDSTQWTADENSLLRFLAVQYSRRWGLIAGPFEGRHTVEDVKKHLELLEKGDMSSEEESEGDYDYEEEKREVKDRHSSLKPMVRWSDEEDAKLIDAIKKYGNDWELVQQEMPGRSRNAIVSRWMNETRTKLSAETIEEMREKFPNLLPANVRKKAVKPVKASTAFSAEEDKLLLEKAKEIGPDWKKVAEHFPGKTAKQVFVHWNTQLKYNISEEDFHVVYPDKKYHHSRTKKDQEEVNDESGEVKP